MLVLSRKKDQQVLFPGLGISVSIQRITGNSVTIGVVAPKSVQVLRSELIDNTFDDHSPRPTAPYLLSSDHDLRNHMNKVQLAIAIARKQLQSKQGCEPDVILAKMLEQLTRIDREFAKSNSISVGEQNIHVNSIENPKSTAIVVEDDPNERALMAGFLRLCDYTVLEAANGLDCLELLDENQVSLVVLDMKMPKLNGSETLQAIRKRPELKGIKVIVVSGEDSLLLKQQTQRYGASDWFAKPLDADRFASTICA